MSDAANTSALVKLRNDPSSRKTFLRALGSGAAAAALGTALAACGKKAGGNFVGGAGVGTSQYGQGDAGIVAYALALEYLEADFYRQAAASGNLTGRALELAKRFGTEEADHVTTLEGAVRNLGGKVPPKPKAVFTLDTQATILSTAYQLESVGVGAYLGQIDRIQSKQVLAVALSIHTVEARHTAAIATLVGRPISTDGPFARPATSVDTLAQIRPFVTA